MNRIILIASAALVLVASGVVHGLWTDRWIDHREEIIEAAQRIEQLPRSFGKWEGNDIPMHSNARTGLAGLLARRYVNQESGKVVTILVGSGRPGPVCTHTPDVCYHELGYKLDAQPRRFPLSGEKGAPEFLTARFCKQRADGESNLRIFWSWHGSNGWKASDNPRLTFAAETVMHKLYVIRDMTNPNEPPEGDACTEFLQEFLPVMQRHLFTPQPV